MGTVHIARCEPCLDLAAAGAGGLSRGHGRLVPLARLHHPGGSFLVVGISHNHLTRLFRSQTGGTVIGHLRARRMARAAHLLRESTMSIRAIAASVGIPDLQAFNKSCRASAGLSPRQIRAGG